MTRPRCWPRRSRSERSLRGNGSTGLAIPALAAIQAPVIMMSQNRQDTKDRLRSELDFEVNRRAEAEIQALTSKLNALADKVDDVGELLRQRA